MPAGPTSGPAGIRGTAKGLGEDLGTPVRNAATTVPAYVGDHQAEDVLARVATGIGITEKPTRP
ncbi:MULTISPECIES: hypothetical protein [Streptomycetaceae]|uniref:hypothetical protein n=1 Tax=Streptomycetaceae TaxID=2062 RepID=UPI00093A8101|nr:hypothetical protein [Streptomyces sp. CB02056]OKI07060.1 hypothetical protein AMK13_17070 [Streptomyces sp. CB02056]